MTGLDPALLEAAGPWLAPIFAYFVVREVVWPRIQRYRYSNGSDRRGLGEKGPSHQTIIDKIETATATLHSRITEVSERLARVEGRLDLRAGGDD